MDRRSLLASATAFAFAPTALAQTEPVRVGMVLPLSGINSLSGTEVVNGITLALEEFNAAGGRRIEIIRGDDAGVPTTGVSAAQKLIERDKVVALIGSQTSAVTLAIGDVARQAKIPVLSGGAVAAALTDRNVAGDPWVFRAIPGSDKQGPESAYDAVNRLKLKKLGILHENTTYGRSLAESFSAFAKQAGAEIVRVDHYEQGEQDFYTVLARMRSSNPDGVYLAGLIAEGAAILRQAHEMQFKVRFVGSGGMVTDSVIELAGAQAAEGFAVSVMFEPNTTNPIGKSFGERYQKRFNIPANTLSGLGYDAGRIVFDAIKRAPAMTGLAVRDAMLTSSVELVEGPPGTRVKFDNKGAASFKLGLAVVKNGRRELLPYE